VCKHTCNTSITSPGWSIRSTAPSRIKIWTLIQDDILVLTATHPLSQSQPFHLTLPLADLPTPSSLRNFWSLGSILGLTVFLQTATGFILSIFYRSSLALSFSSVIHTQIETSYGWLLRATHRTGARILFLLLFLHIGRGLYYRSFRFHQVWLSGVSLFLGYIAVAFLGYVLPWGQISFWGATVITSLLSTIPYWGQIVVDWIWGGFSVSEPTLSRFYSFHFFFPLALLLIITLHILFLHLSGRSNPLGIGLSHDKVPFHPYFSFKDVSAMVVTLIIWVFLVCCFPWAGGDADNFIPANPIVTPEHIKPEWYFLFAYAILRSVPNKLGGVIGLLLSVLVLVFIVASPTSMTARGKSSTFKLVFWAWVRVWVILSWLGAQPVEDPFVGMRQLYRVLYFSLVLLVWLSRYRGLSARYRRSEY